MKRLSALFICLIIFVSIASYTHAQSNVLGASTDPKSIEFPDVTSGPGFILPDSPLYFLDELKQTAKLALAMGPRSKALIHSQIAGERLAELKVMMERGNSRGIQIALNGLSYETEAAVKDMNDAKAQGKDVKKLAEILNESIKEQREVLASVENQSEGALALLLQATSYGMRNAKIDVEKNLPQPNLENEYADAVFESVDNAVLGISNIQNSLPTATEQLRKQASQAAQNMLLEKQQELAQAKKEGNTEKIKAAEAALAQEIAKQKKFLEQLTKALDEAQKAIENAASSTASYKQAKDAMVKTKLGN